MKSVRLMACFLVFWASPCLSAAPLRIGVEDRDRPISFQDPTGRPSGFTIELIAAMQQEGLGEVKIICRSWVDILEDFRAGKIDVLANVIPTENRLAEMSFSIAHAEVKGVVFTAAVRPRITQVEQLRGRTLGTLLGSISESTARLNNGWGATLRSFPNAQTLAAAVLSGECDAALFPFGLDSKYPELFQPGLNRTFMREVSYNFSFASHPNDLPTLARLNNALNRVRARGTFDRIYRQWIGDTEPRDIALVDIRPYTAQIISCALALAAVFFWQRRLLNKLYKQTKELTEGDRRFQAMFKSSYTGWVIHRQGTVLLLNETAAAILGRRLDAFTGKSVLAFIAPEAREAMRELIKSELPTLQRTVGLRANGDRVHVEFSGHPCSFAGEPARLISIRDLTAQRQQIADQLILSKLEATGVLAGGIAHDFNNLLASLQLNLEIILSETNLSKVTISHTDKALKTIKSASGLTRQLIIFAQGESATPEPTDISLLINRCLEMSLAGAAVDAKISVTPNLWSANVDPLLIERAFCNIILNAREAAPSEGHLKIDCENITLTASTVPNLGAGSYIKTTFTDNGAGMSPDLCLKIFDPYFSTKQRGASKGMGLGLTVCHRIVQQHGGAITVNSQLAQGTTFAVYLPAITTSPGALIASPITTNEPPLRAIQAQKGTESKSTRILVMEDEEILRETLQVALEASGYSVESADNGTTAITLYEVAQAEGRPFAAALLDLTVRGNLGGIETIKRLRQLDPQVKAIVMSGHTESNALRQFAEHGFSGCLPKPFEFGNLLRLLDKITKP